MTRRCAVIMRRFKKDIRCTRAAADVGAGIDARCVRQGGPPLPVVPKHTCHIPAPYRVICPACTEGA